MGTTSTDDRYTDTRRSFLRKAGTTGVLLAVPMSTSVAEAQSHSRDFFYNWDGKYTGVTDGGSAKLEVKLEEVRPKKATVVIDVSYPRAGLHGEDFIYRGKKDVPFRKHPHIIENVRLKHLRGSATMDVKRLYLHTWNTNDVSGYYRQFGETRGLAFSTGWYNMLRNFPAVQLTESNWTSRWPGTYSGSGDGRPANLSIERVHTLSTKNRAAFRFTVDGGEGTESYSGVKRVKRSTSKPQELKNVRLYSRPGGEIRFNRLYLHQLSTNTISAETKWGGTEYGAFYNRQSL
ncbi:hypothetical protein [Haloarchaeobius sp. TZWWS8]|uniref:hypothetical protein n=1 Tax=Haloarchaeobius sp. TZWWS8 TaxID=3446121 RepID=UPI003EBE60E0